ncbi:MAG: transglutaminase [Kofleriaceae bacterium]|nr:transglutaminase [Planctomycetota bacterium]MCA9675640.1 transglutaminase [Myxococcales bacterium]MCB9560765.1 transglutaminase [Kofleriaceae bacterium]
MTLDGHGSDVRIRSFLPLSDEHQQISDEQSSAPGMHFTSDTTGPSRLATWTGNGVPDGARLRYGYSLLASPLQFDLDPELPVPDGYGSSLAPYLRPEDDIQVDAPEIAATLHQIGADHGSTTARLHAIYDYTSSLPQRPFKGTTDALTALRLGEASCNGKSRLFVALARAAGLPARLVGGLILQSGTKRTSHQWVEVYIAGHWVPFCPTNHHFASLPETYLVLYRGDEALFRHTADVNFDYRFHISTSMVPSPGARESFGALNVWALFDRLGLPFMLLQTVLMLPVGALVVVLFRNVIGLPTFGTFLPALIAAGAGQTGPWWGIVGVLIAISVVVLLRWAIQRLELLHSPTLAILLAGVTTALLGTSLLAERFGQLHLARVTFFPIAVLAIASERFYLAVTEQGTPKALKELGGTLVVTLACFVVMHSLALQIVLVGFPEVLLLVVAANVYLGRWVGVRLLEYRRFTPVLTGGAP